MTREELAKCDGRGGRKACVAVNGNVYDFTGSTLWKNGDHQGAHQAGVDLTEELRKAPHVRAVIERFPVIGTLEEPSTAPAKPRAAKSLLFPAAAVFILIVLYWLLR